MNWRPMNAAPDAKPVFLYCETLSGGQSIVYGYRRTWIGKGWVQVNATTQKYKDLRPQSEWCFVGSPSTFEIDYLPKAWCEPAPDIFPHLNPTRR